MYTPVRKYIILGGKWKQLMQRWVWGKEGKISLSYHLFCHRVMFGPVPSLPAVLPGKFTMLLSWKNLRHWCGQWWWWDRPLVVGLVGKWWWLLSPCFTLLGRMGAMPNTYRRVAPGPQVSQNVVPFRNGSTEIGPHRSRTVSNSSAGTPCQQLTG